MKYSLKNRQFRKRNNIFGDRKKDQPLPEFIIHDLDAIKESMEESEESKYITPQPQPKRNEKLWKFINFQQDSNDIKEQYSRKDIKKYSLEARPNRNSLSPIHKPILNNPNIRLTESTVRLPKAFEIDSQTVNFCYYPKIKPDESEEIKNLLKKLFKILLKNNQRVDQLQQLIQQIVNRGHLVAKQLNQGLRSMLSMEQQTNLFFNTMRSVYQNLRVCKLKQQNLELYFKQNKEEKINQQQQAFFNNLTVKYEKPKVSLSNRKHFESYAPENEKESRELARLIEYESDSSLNQINSVQRFTEKASEGQASSFKKPHKNHEVQNFLDPVELSLEPPLTQNNEYEQLSPFQANRMIMSSIHSTDKSNSQQFVRSQQKPTVHQSYFATFQPNKQPQANSQYQKVKAWLRTSNQIGLRCWLDEMGCLRRNNNTYIFNQGGQVMTMSSQTFQRLSDQGLVVPVFGAI